MKHLVWSSVFVLAVLPSLVRADETNKWTCDVSLYGFAAGMTGDVTVKGIPADLNVGFDEVWKNLEFSLMGKVRVGHGRWALTVDVIDMELGTSKNGVRGEFEQWMIEPTVSYRLCRNFEVLTGIRYSNLSGGSPDRSVIVLPGPEIGRIRLSVATSLSRWAGTSASICPDSEFH